MPIEEPRGGLYAGEKPVPGEIPSRIVAVWVAFDAGCMGAGPNDYIPVLLSGNGWVWGRFSDCLEQSRRRCDREFTGIFVLCRAVAGHGRSWRRTCHCAEQLPLLSRLDSLLRWAELRVLF